MYCLARVFSIDVSEIDIGSRRSRAFSIYILLGAGKSLSDAVQLLRVGLWDTVLVVEVVVGLEVDLEVALLGEEFLAEVALERLHAQVLAKVDLQAGLLRVGHEAQLALMRLDLAVVHQVGLQVPLRDEGVVAAGVQALERAVVCLYNKAR